MHLRPIATLLGALAVASTFVPSQADAASDAF